MFTPLVLVRFVHLLVVLLLFGTWGFRRWLLGAAPQPVLDRQLARISWWLAWTALISALAWLLLIAASMAGVSLAALEFSTIQLVLSKTLFGHVWSWHLALNGLLLLCLSTRWAALRLALCALLLATLAPIGHGAMLDGLAGQWLILNQALHLLCVGAWLGGLLLLVLILRQPDRYALEPLLTRFSGVGYVLVTGLLVSGLINIRVLTGQFWPTPLLSGFALILLIKALLVLAMLGLALFNRLRIKDCQQRLGTLKASVGLEWLLGIAAVGVVSLLGTLPPMLMAN